MGHLNRFSALGEGGFKQKFSKNSNTWGLPRGMSKLRFDCYITLQLNDRHPIKVLSLMMTGNIMFMTLNLDQLLLPVTAFAGGFQNTNK